MSPPRKRFVRFDNSTTDQPPQKRSRPIDGNLENSERTPRPSALKPSFHRAISKNSDRVNEDELDDIDDWNEQEDGDPDDSGSGALPSQSQLIEAKRKRREQRGLALFNQNDKYSDETETSLATDGVKIEPFHMREEETDGTGYFDGDTYVFRKNVPTEDGEPDAWADTLIRNGNVDLDDGDEDRPTMSIARNVKTRKKSESSANQEDLDDLPKEQLYKRILPLMGDGMESIMDAIRRYGKFAQTKSNSKHRRKNQKLKEQHANDDGKSINTAKLNLDNLTGAANALLLKGEVDIYNKTKQDILRIFPSLLKQLQDSNPDKNTPSTMSRPKWEYQGNGDNQLHGPYTTEQMMAWVQSGYFIGAQRVKIRTIHTEKQDPEEILEPQLSTEDDLLADLMDDDDVDEASRPAKKVKKSSSLIVKGKWIWSDEIDYQKYL
mmetsp:Transcript_16651/g.38440  ORF Transcript_16651/g.38440 Transcript_16651/m.38440 type:complete len:436 (-) Transcript_16651:27-1334(-)